MQQDSERVLASAIDGELDLSEAFGVKNRPGVAGRAAASE